MRNFGFVAMLLAASCGQSKAPVTPINPSDGGQAVSCEPALAKARVLYAQAAIDEGLAPNLHADFIEANTHMVMVDCQARPAKSKGVTSVRNKRVYVLRSKPRATRQIR